MTDIFADLASSTEADRGFSSRAQRAAVHSVITATYRSHLGLIKLKGLLGGLKCSGAMVEGPPPSRMPSFI